MSVLKQIASFANPQDPFVFYVTDRKSLRSQRVTDLAERIRMAMAARCDFVQIREKDMSSRMLIELTKDAVTAATATASTRILVNDRLDVALAAGAAGIHLGGASLPLREVKPYAVENHAPDFLIGVSCHSLEEAQAAEREGASYVFFGPVFDTPSKRAFGSPQGLERLKKVCVSVQIPVVAIGGVNEKNMVECIDAGVAGIGAIRMFQEKADTASLTAAIARIHALQSK